MTARVLATWGVSTLLVTGSLTACSSPEAEVASTWSPKAAAAYLDQRAEWWMGWEGAARDHGTDLLAVNGLRGARPGVADQASDLLDRDARV